MTSTTPVTATLKRTRGRPSPTPRRLARTLAWLENFRRHKSPAVVAQVAPGARVVLRRSEGATCSCGASGGCGHVAAARAEWGLR